MKPIGQSALRMWKESVVWNQSPVSFQANREHDNSYNGWIQPRISPATAPHCVRLSCSCSLGHLVRAQVPLNTVVVKQIQIQSVSRESLGAFKLVWPANKNKQMSRGNSWGQASRGESRIRSGGRTNAKGARRVTSTVNKPIAMKVQTWRGNFVGSGSRAPQDLLQSSQVCLPQTHCSTPYRAISCWKFLCKI